MLFYSNSLPLNQQTNKTSCLHDLVLKPPILIGVLISPLNLHELYDILTGSPGFLELSQCSSYGMYQGLFIVTGKSLAHFSSEGG